MQTRDEWVEINHNLNWRYILGDPYRISINGDSESEKICVIELDKKIDDQILIKLKFTYMSKNHSNQSINCLLAEDKK